MRSSMQMDNKSTHCPLCHTKNTIRNNELFQCPECSLTFKHPHLHLNAELEKKHYLNHENDPSEIQYQDFLSRLYLPLSKKLSQPAHGLDYGCGPTKGLEKLLNIAPATLALTCQSYDPYFYDDQTLLNKTYDFIFCSEVVEHFYYPAHEFNKLHKLLKPKGWLAIMTQFTPEQLENWWYLRDPTHVVFYSSETMHWIARKYQYSLEVPSNGIALFQK